MENSASGSTLKNRLIGIVLIGLAFAIGYFMGGGPAKDDHIHTPAETTPAIIWTCSMHPQIRQPNPGKCPLCGMDLIPVKSNDDHAGGSGEVVLSERARKLAQVQTATVKREFMETELRLVGKVAYDETRLRHVAARISGRIDRMFVNYTGVMVNAGDHLVEIYSPELLSAQQELIQTVRAAKNITGSASELAGSTDVTLNAVREKLRLWGLTDAQIKAIEDNGQPAEHLTLYSPISGVVTAKPVDPGAYVEMGMTIYDITDLSKVWVQIDAYESDLAWLHYGQMVTFETETYPGEVFSGRIAFINPTLDDMTRTIKVRVNVDNKDGRLKPDMFVRATVQAQITPDGKVIDSGLAGKWISPMHPEIVKSGPGSCDICGMALVRAEELGYISAKNVKKEAPLIIPASAPLITGRRALVYVESPDQAGVYQSREVTLGPRAGDFYLVKSGLNEGEKVVINGNFKIDSAAQLLGKPSMMNPPKDGHAGHDHAEVKPVSTTTEKLALTTSAALPDNVMGQLDAVYAAYFDLQFALSHDNPDNAKKAAQQVTAALQKTDMKAMSEAQHYVYMPQHMAIKQSAGGIANAADLEAARTQFQPMSNALIALAEAFGSKSHKLLKYHCPMAFDFKGADWLQGKDGTENPYFGSEMFSCGSKKADLSKGHGNYK